MKSNLDKATEIAQYFDWDVPSEQFNCVLTALDETKYSEGDICPACATEFESGTFKSCGGSIINEVIKLRSEVEMLKKTLQTIATPIIEKGISLEEFNNMTILQKNSILASEQFWSFNIAVKALDNLKGVK